MENEEQLSSSEQYEIGSVSRITDISTHRLRMWERRYQNLKPSRTESGRRLYSSKDIQKLILIKNLLDSGHSIGMIAGLSIEELEKRISDDPKLLKFYNSTKKDFEINIGYLGFDLITDIQDKFESKKNNNLWVAESDKKSFADKIENQNLDLLVFEFETLSNAVINEIYNYLNISQAKHAILIYWFTETKVLEDINKSLITTMRGPVNIEELSIICRNVFDIKEHYEIDGENVDRIYDVSELAKIASYSSLVKCECPHQLVSLLYSLNSFEKYSLECENRNLEDAKLHRFLYEITGEARLLIEKALKKVVEIEGIEY